MKNTNYSTDSNAEAAATLEAFYYAGGVNDEFNYLRQFNSTRRITIMELVKTKSEYMFNQLMADEDIKTLFI